MSWATEYETFIKAHEKIILVGVLSFTVFHMYSKGVDAWIQKTSRTAQNAAVAVKTDDTLVKSDTAQLKALQIQVAAQSALISKQIAQRNQSVQVQQKVDKSLPPSALANRWQMLLGLSAGNVTINGVIDPVTGQQFVTTDEAAVQTVTQLESVPVLEANEQSLQTELNNDGTIITKQTQLIAELTTELADEKKSHVADVNAEKAKGKSSFVHGLKIGLGIGFIAGLFAGHAI